MKSDNFSFGDKKFKFSFFFIAKMGSFYSQRDTSKAPLPLLKNFDKFDRVAI